MAPPDSDSPALTPLMRQYLGIKRNHPDCVLFFRMGDFYEMFFEDAKVASRALNIALTSRDREGDSRTPMCGIPYHALESYLGKMVKGGHKVAICEQMEDPKAAKGIVKREVVRIVTPGTVTEDYLLDGKKANWLAAVSSWGDGAGLACADLSTGRFTVREFTGPGWLDPLKDELERVQPGELLVADDSPISGELDGVEPEKLDITAFDPEEGEKSLSAHLGVSTLEGFGLAGKKLALSSAGAILWYVKKNSPLSLASLDSIKLVQAGSEMELDPATVRNLEIVQNLSDRGSEGTLAETLDETATPMGARLLRERLVKPLKDPAAIMERQGLVTSFFNDRAVCAEFARLLSGVGDLERCMGRIAGKTQTPRDFSSLMGSLKQLPALGREAGRLAGENINGLMTGWDNLDELAELLHRGVNPDHPPTFKEPGFIRSGYSAELDGIRAFKEDFASQIRALETTEREATGISSLKVGYNRIYGYYLEITNKHSAKAPARYIRKQSLVNCERFVSPELKEMEEKLLSSEEKLKALEDALVAELREKTLAYVKRVRNAADLVAQLDVACALADIAKKRDYCPPEMSGGGELLLEGARHPVIERLMTEGNFVPNDISMTEGPPRLMVLTGPNMAGKSTYLRQVALAVLMAQAGGYVPAKRARIGVVDRIFTRVGAQDRLQKGLSTFMVEMVETANILNNATGKSLVILDEIGRGTSTFDGISIAWAVAEFLSALGARTVFATHYNELTDLESAGGGAVNFNVAVKEYREKLVFLRRVEAGPADKSYGIQVARLAGLPKEVLKRAKSVLGQLEKMEFSADGKPALMARNGKDEPQISLFEARPSPALEALKDADVEKMTPLDALNFLHKLKEMA